MYENVIVSIQDGENTYIQQAKTCVPTIAVANENLQHQQSSVAITTNYAPELIELFSRLTTVKATIISDTNIIFTGIITTDLSWTDNGQPYPIEDISFTVKDNTYLFETETLEEIGLENTNLETIIQTICTKCNVTIQPNQERLPAAIEIEAFVVTQGKKYSQVLSDVMYQYGFSYYFDPLGQLVWFDFTTIPETPQILDQTEIMHQAKVQKTSKNYEKVTLKHFKLTTKENELVYFDGFGYDSGNKVSPTVIQPGIYFPFESSPIVEADEGVVEQSFLSGYAEEYQKYNGETALRRTGDTSLLYTKNQTVTNDWEGGNLTIDRTNFGFTKAQIRFKNNTQNDINLFSLSVRASAIYQDTEVTITAGTGTSEYTVESSYIYNTTYAEKLANILFQYFCQTKYKLTLKTEKYIAPGTFVTVDTGLSGFSSKALVLSTQKDYETDIYTLTLITIGNATIDVTRFKTQENKRLNGIYAENAKTNDRIDGIEDGTSTELKNPDKPIIIQTIAGQDLITLEIAPVGIGLNNTILEINWEMRKGAEGEWLSIGSSTITKFDYNFNRVTDGYPEKEDLQTWYIRCKAINIAEKESVYSDAVAVNTSFYQTWKLLEPNVKVDTDKRTVMLTINQPVRADGLIPYGTVQNQIQIRKTGTDPQDTFFKPATSKDPLSAEDAYKDGDGFVLSNVNYNQSLPLTGQNLTPPIPEATAYQYKVVSVNEAGPSEATIVNANAIATGIQDIVANAVGTNAIQNGAVVGDKIHVDFITSGNVVSEELSVIKAALGYILGDSFHYENGQKVYNNFVTLSTIQLDDGMHYEGDVRFGDENEYIRIKPIVVNNMVQRYEVNFKAGVFTVESNKTTLNGEVVVQLSDNTLDRTRITPTGTFYEHRDTEQTDWYEISSTSTAGVKSTSLRSDSSLVISNASQELTRTLGHDIGKPYLSENARVYHFDTDINDQKQNNDLTIDGDYSLVGFEDSNGINYTPAILSVSPYSNVAKSIYGEISITTQMPSTQTALIDFWLQYLYAENQILFDVGTISDRLQLAITTDEPLACKSAPSFWGSTFYTDGRNPKIGDNVYEDEALTIISGQIEATTLGDGFAVATISVSSTIYDHTSGEPDWNWEIFAPESEWGETSVLANRAAEGSVKLTHIGQTQEEEIDLSEINKEFKEYNWHHIAIQLTATQIIFMFDDVEKPFNRYSVSADEIDIIINQSKTSLICDELYIDTQNQSLLEFSMQTEKRLPWGSLDYQTVQTIFDAADPTKVKSNILDYRDSLIEEAINDLDKSLSEDITATNNSVSNVSNSVTNMNTFNSNIVDTQKKWFNKTVKRMCFDFVMPDTVAGYSAYEIKSNISELIELKAFFQYSTTHIFEAPITNTNIQSGISTFINVALDGNKYTISAITQNNAVAGNRCYGYLEYTE